LVEILCCCHPNCHAVFHRALSPSKLLQVFWCYFYYNINAAMKKLQPQILLWRKGLNDVALMNTNVWALRRWGGAWGSQWSGWWVILWLMGCDLWSVICCDRWSAWDQWWDVARSFTGIFRRSSFSVKTSRRESKPNER
jgi:hypothetical protein